MASGAIVPLPSPSAAGSGSVIVEVPTATPTDTPPATNTPSPSATATRRPHAEDDGCAVAPEANRCAWWLLAPVIVWRVRRRQR